VSFRSPPALLPFFVADKKQTVRALAPASTIWPAAALMLQGPLARLSLRVRQLTFD
jgi:hypothetical protein